MDIGGAILALHGAVFVAAVLQAATGIGFGVIAGPVLLIALDDGSAVQITILLSLLIAAVLAPTLLRAADRGLLRRLALGTLAGLPLGIAVFVLLGTDLLKLLAGASVLFMAALAAGLIARPAGGGGARGRIGDIGVGVLSGVMSASLAMPGPVVAARMTALAHPKDATRATVLLLFVFSYTAAILLQAGTVGVAGETLTLTATLAPATLLGIAVGKGCVGWIGERAFRRVIVAVLVATAAGLLISAMAALS